MHLTPIDKPMTHGVYYYGNTHQRLKVTFEHDQLVANGDNFANVPLCDLYGQWFTPVLPPVQDCIDYIKIAGWNYGGYGYGYYTFYHRQKTLQFTLKELRDAFRNGF